MSSCHDQNWDVAVATKFCSFLIVFYMFLYTFPRDLVPVQSDREVCGFRKVNNPMDTYGVQRNGEHDVGERDVMSGRRVIDGGHDLGEWHVTNGRQVTSA